jgi:hypothetical protein
MSEEETQELGQALAPGEMELDDEEDLDRAQPYLKGEQSKIEMQHEENLQVSEVELEMNEHDPKAIQHAIGSLVALKLYLSKWAKEGSEAEEIKVINDAITKLKNNAQPLYTMKSLNQYIFPLLGRKKYRFNLSFKKNSDFKKKILDKLQIEDKLSWRNPIFQSPELNPETNAKLYQLAYIVDWYVRKNNQDFVCLIGGYPGQGKSTLAAMLMLMVWQIRGMSLKQKNVERIFREKIIYNDKGNLRSLMQTSKEDTIMVDEAFFQFFNEDTMKREVRELTKVLYSVRNRRNIYFICISELVLATLPLQRRALAHFIIPRTGMAYFYMKYKPAVAQDDPLHLKEMRKAYYDWEVDNALIRKPDYVTKFHVSNMKQKWFDIYDNIKEKEQEEKAERDEMKEQSFMRDEQLIEKAMEEYEAGTKDIRNWLISKGWPKKFATKLEEEVIRRVLRERDLKGEQQQMAVMR